MTINYIRKNLIQYLISFVFVLFLIPISFYYQPVKGLDPSWQIAMNLAFKYHLVFGKDICFTYGPLSIFYTRLPISINLYVYLFFDLYLLYTVFSIIKEVITKHFKLSVILFILLCIIPNSRLEPSMWFYLITLYYLFDFLSYSNKKWPLIQSVIFSIAGFYFKVSLGFCGIIIFLLCLTYLLLAKKIKLFHFLLIIACYSFVFWLTSILLNTNLTGYIKSSLHFIDSYNDGMFIPLSANSYWILWIAIIIIALLIVAPLFYYFDLKKGLKGLNMHQLLIYSIISLSTYMVFKSGFVRGIDHVQLFFSFSCLLAGLFFLSLPNNSKRIIGGVSSWIVLVLTFIVLNSFFGSNLIKKTLTFNFVSEKVKTINIYITNLIKYKSVQEYSRSLDTTQNELKNIIGNGTVDVVPSEISKIYFNGLNYNPRPVIQSYAAYDKYLDSLNYLKYMSATAPDYILFSLESIDYKYPFFEESKTKIAILNRYAIIKKYDDFLLLKKKDKNEDLLKKLDKSDNAEYKFGQDIPIKYSDNLQYSYITLDYSLWGKIRRLLYQPPLLKINFTLQDGETKSYKVIKSVLDGGVFLNKFISGTEDFEMLMKSQGKMNANITNIRFETDDLSKEKGFTPKIFLRNTYYSFIPKAKAERDADSIYLSNQMNRYQIKLADSITFTEGQLKVGIDYYKNYTDLLEISGWAFMEKSNNNNSEINVILKSTDHIYKLQTNISGREDLITYFKRNDLVTPGFTAKGSKYNLPAGTYKIGIMISKNSKNLVQFLPDYTFNIPIKPEKISSNKFENDTSKIMYNLETIQDNGNELHLSGWAFIKQRNSQTSKTNIILQNPTASYRIQADLTIRKDVSSYFKNSNLDSTGFKAMVPKEGLPSGHYTIILEKIDGDKSYHILTGKSIDIQEAK